MRAPVSVSRKRRQKGQAMVESALTFTILFFMLIAIIDFGQLLYFHSTLTDRVRAAARYAAVNPTATTNAKNIAIYNTPTPAMSTKPILPGLTPEMINVQLLDAGTPAARVTVDITNFTVRFLTPGIGKVFKAQKISATLSSEAP